ncbi:hypothetical protein BBOV_I004130 [Babesia bovis T2Bo]|uniref:Uncharacterized protein n=1 Tax=Babesia bovis TaxID=5865 RepID=A7AWR6_BABBO|nr:hypothetical protein BBOV_I004130 [Babesia bovis T2Bo]EDO05494.1 hypothetical protein BBOV_I004130 [Babesia bovis T2Bo]|eukprot:XP_001609062.1 hypothetical protein [Babesia bovis T2Bo]
MLNLLPKRNPASSLLYGKTGLQRIRVGKERKVVEIDRKTIDEMYKHIRDDVELHNDFVPMKHQNYMEYKLDGYHLIEAYENPDKCHKSPLVGARFFDKLRDTYAGKLQQTHAKVLKEVATPFFSYPVRGKNV